MPTYPKRLIEVDLPIRRISAQARREKSIRHGHISTLHIWWARRPLAACRAVICAALWPDPADEQCPRDFVDTARRLMLEWTSHERQVLLSAESQGHFEAVAGETARLLPVGERARFLFGKDEGKLAPQRKKREAQMDLFKVLAEADGGESTFGETKVERYGETVLDRIHQSMILFAAGRGEALKRFIVEDGAGRDQRFWSLAQALSALYPSHTEEKRWVDGVLARKKGLGF